MEFSPIYTTEPMVTRALAAEIRWNARPFLDLLERRAGTETFGDLRRVKCEAVARIDVLLEFERDGDPFRVGIEAKFDHELTRRQIRREASGVDRLFTLVVCRDAVPKWFDAEFPDVLVIDWREALACFRHPRITFDDLAAIKISKTVVEAKFNELSFEGRLADWRIETERGDRGMPSITFESPELPCGRTLRGQIQVAGRSMPDSIDDVCIEGHFGIAVADDEENYFDPEQSNAVPDWIERLKTLQSEVLDGQNARLLINENSPGHSRRPFGRWKVPLAKRHLGKHAYLAKGYVDWAIGPKTKVVPLDRLDELAEIAVDIFGRWYDAEVHQSSR